MDKAEIKQLLTNALNKQTELCSILQETKYTLYGEYLGTLLFNEILRINKPLPKPTLTDWYLFQNISSNYGEVVETSEYKLYKNHDYIHFGYGVNFNSLLAQYTDNKLNIYIDDSIINLINTRQLEIVNLYSPLSALIELVDLRNKYLNYLYADIDKAIAMVNDLTLSLDYKERELITTDYGVQVLASVPDVKIKYIIPRDYRGALLPLVTLPYKRLIPDTLLVYLKTSKDNIPVSVYLDLVNFLYGYGIKKSTRETRLTVMQYPQLFEYCFRIPNYLDKLPNGWKAKLSLLNKFLADHSVKAYFTDKTLAEQLQLFDELRGLIKEYGVWIIGLLENYTKPYKKEEFIKLIKIKKLENSKWLVNPFALPELPYGLSKHWKIVELNTRLLLMAEGEYQNHCVGGYSVSETHRIFSFRKDRFRYTVEISYSATYSAAPMWRVRQARGKNNLLLDSFDPAIVKELNILLPWLITVLPKPTLIPNSRIDCYLDF